MTLSCSQIQWLETQEESTKDTPSWLHDVRTLAGGPKAGGDSSTSSICPGFGAGHSDLLGPPTRPPHGSLGFPHQRCWVLGANIPRKGRNQIVFYYQKSHSVTSIVVSHKTLHFENEETWTPPPNGKSVWATLQEEITCLCWKMWSATSFPFSAYLLPTSQESFFILFTIPLLSSLLLLCIDYILVLWVYYSSPKFSYNPTTVL